MQDIHKGPYPYHDNTPQQYTLSKGDVLSNVSVSLDLPQHSGYPRKQPMETIIITSESYPIYKKDPIVAKKIESAVQWILSRSWADSVQFIILYGSVAQGCSSPLSDIDMVIGLTENSQQMMEIRKELILTRPWDDIDIRLFEHLPVYIQKDIFKGFILYCRDLIELYDLAYGTIKRYQAFKPYLDDYIGVAPLP